MQTIASLATIFVIVHSPAPELQPIWLNPADIVTMREPVTDHLDRDVHCAITTSDGKFVSTAETCEMVRILIRDPLQTDQILRLRR
jgi:hypothetical protein